MDDLISRQAAIDALTEYGNGRAVFISVGEAVIRIENLPPAEPKRIRGKWVGADTQCSMACSVCGVAVDDFCHSIDYIDLDYEPNFCPNCGADMRTAEQIVHDAIDNTPMAEDAYPGIKERLHKAVDDMREVINGN